MTSFEPAATSKTHPLILRYSRPRRSKDKRHQFLIRALLHFSNKSADGTIRNFSLLMWMGSTSITLSCARISAGTFGLLYWIGDGAFDKSSFSNGTASLATIER